jgi:pheromone shutdown-related protein TraB
MHTTWRNAIIIGTSHIADESVKEVKQIMEVHKPAIVCVELDRHRYHSLMQPSQENRKIPFSLAKRVGMTGYLFAVLGNKIQKKLGAVVNINPGTEMKTATEMGIEANAAVYLIDQTLEETLRDFSDKFTFREKFRLFRDIFFTPKEFKNLKNTKMVLSKTPPASLINKLVYAIERRYPGLFEALIGKRNRIMAKKIFGLSHANPAKKVLVVVGAGHVPGIHEELKRLERSVDVVEASSIQIPQPI